MGQRVMSLREWNDCTYDGVSPGGAAAWLGISRQAVHYAMERGDLDSIRIVGDDGSLKGIIISADSIKAFERLRTLKAG